MSAALMTVTCLLLNLLVSRSALMRIDEAENYIMEIEPASQESFVINVDNSELLAQIRQVKNTFRIQSIAVTVIIILLSGALHIF